MRPRRQIILIHVILIGLAVLVYLPFYFVLNNSMRTNTETYESYFGVPNALKELIGLRETPTNLVGKDAERTAWQRLTRGYSLAWPTLRRYMLNAIFVSTTVALGTIFLGSVSAYVFSRYHFFGRNVLFGIILSTMMVPGILTLTPAFLWVKKLGLLNSYWVLILPYIAGGQVFAIFVCRSFFASLPEELFESARIDGAGHASIYWNIVLPLSMPVLSVVAIMNILGSWNNFLWPFITNNDDTYHVISSGLYVMSNSQLNTNAATLNAAYILSSIPLLILFIYATKPFMRGVTSGALKA